MNPMTLIDGYKFGHRDMNPKGLTKMQANWTARGSRIPGVDKVVFFGLQYYLQRFLAEEFQRGFFDQPAEKVIAKYARRVDGYLGPGKVGTDHILALHKLGHIPLKFLAISEGRHVPLRVPMFIAENTHPDFAWVVTYFESLMSSVIWQPCTSATIAYQYRKLLTEAAVKTGAPVGFVDWQGHDFSFRGLAGPDAAALSGAAHLLFFTGTDTVPALDLIEDYYGPLPPDYLLGGSVPATEHSVMCAGGELSERETFERLLGQYPTGIVSVVSDTWDLWKVLTETLPALKDKIMARDGKLIIRPDSGDPADIICGDPKAPFGSPASQGVVELLWNTFGGTMTDGWHRQLDPHVGCIYGDAITLERANDITERLAAKQFASSNVVYGIGSFTYQHVTRDTFGFAWKATWVEVDGVGRTIFKSPVTDDGTKFSARGRLAALRHHDGSILLANEATPEQEAISLYQPVWQDGKFLRRETFDVIRARAMLG